MFLLLLPLTGFSLISYFLITIAKSNITRRDVIQQFSSAFSIFGCFDCKVVLFTLNFHLILCPPLWTVLFQKYAAEHFSLILHVHHHKLPVQPAISSRSFSSKMSQRGSHICLEFHAFRPQNNLPNNCIYSDSKPD